MPRRLWIARWISKRLRQECERSGVDAVRFMDTRHHTATRLINEGVPAYHVQKALGHTDSRMTQRYLKAREAKLHEALAVLDRPRKAATLSEAA